MPHLKKKYLTKIMCVLHSITKLPYIITVKWQVITTLHVTHLFSRIVIILQCNPQTH